MGDGAARADLVSRAESFPTGARASVTVLPHASSADARELMRTADLGLVTLQPGVIRLAYPSKTMTYLSEGLPLLVGVEADSELATTVRAEGIGFVLEALDAAAVRTTLLDLHAQNRRDRTHASSCRCVRGPLGRARGRPETMG